jgi:glycosyltransferase involved in cell wall biosynthesis
MIRIGLDVSILEEPRWTGVERAAAGLVRALAARDSDALVHLYSRRPMAWTKDLGPRLVSRPLGGPSRLALWREATLPRALRADRVHVLHSPVAAIPLLTRVPRIATIHEMPWLHHPGIEGRRREAIYRARIRIAARVAVRLAVPSETVARDLAALCPGVEGKTSVLPFGVEEFFRPLSGSGWKAEARRRLSLPDGPVVLFVGKARRKKNLEVLVRAVGHLRETMRPAPVLALAGVDAGDFPATAGVLPLGFVPDRDLVRLYNLARVVAYPSLSEGFGFPPLEAMACGTPVVAARAGAVPEVVQDAALLVDPTSPAELAGALKSAIEDPALRRRLADLGRTRVLRFEWPGVADRAFTLLSSVAA